MERWGIRDVNNGRAIFERFAGPPRLSEAITAENQFTEALSPMRAWGQVSDSKPMDPNNRGNPHQALSVMRNTGQQIANTVASSGARNARLPETSKLYIPVFRSLREVAGPNRDDLLAECTRRAYFSDKKHTQIFTGQSLFNKIEELALGDLSQRTALKKFEEWISESFFQGEPVAVIPRKGQQVLTLKIGKEQEKPIHDLGDGIQSLLILASPLFERANEHLLVFMEAPELFLHPWLQRVLLEVLSGSRFPRHQYFLTTHSNHFFDLTIDIPSVSVFTFEKSLEGDSEFERPPRFEVENASRSDRRPLELLGVRNSSVFLSNCTIWVEGITDRRYIARWIDIYQSNKWGGSAARNRAHFYKEDLHYSFVEYGGGNVVHWSFLDEEGPDVERLCGTLFLVADSDNAPPGSAKAKRHETLQKTLGKRFHLLAGAEIENLLTPAILKQVPPKL